MTVKLSKQFCKCLEENNITSLKVAEPCFEQVMFKNADELYKFYKVNKFEDIDFDAIGNQIAVYLVKECDYIQPYLIDPIESKTKDTLSYKKLECKRIKGDFYYVQMNQFTMKSDSTFVTITDNIYLERMKNGKTFSLLDIEWIDDCNFEIIFKESNDPFKKALSKKGDVYKYEIISSTYNSFQILMKWKEQEYKFTLHTLD